MTLVNNARRFYLWRITALLVSGPVQVYTLTPYKSIGMMLSGRFPTSPPGIGLADKRTVCSTRGNELPGYFRIFGSLWLPSQAIGGYCTYEVIMSQPNKPVSNCEFVPVSIRLRQFFIFNLSGLDTAGGFQHSGHHLPCAHDDRGRDKPDDSCRDRDEHHPRRSTGHGCLRDKCDIRTATGWNL